MPSKELTAALKLAEERNLRFVSLQFTDIVGQVKSVQVPMHRWRRRRAREVVRRQQHRGLRPHRRVGHVPGARPGHLLADPLGAGPRPMAPSGTTGAARVICDVFTPNDPFPGDPRWVLRRQLEKAKKLGYV